MTSITYTNKELSTLLQASKHRRIVFEDGENRIEIAAKLIRDFLAAGKDSETLYTVSLLCGDHRYTVKHAYTETRKTYKGYLEYDVQSIEHPAEYATIERCTGIKIEYVTGVMSGHAVFKDGAGIRNSGESAKRIAWHMESTVFVDLRTMTARSDIDPALTLKGKKQQIEIVNQDGTRETTTAIVYGPFALGKHQVITHVPTGLQAAQARNRETAIKAIHALTTAGDVESTDKHAVAAVLNATHRHLRDQGLIW